ncbi:MAG: hypothetical protein DRH57_08290 [Candidatus Cloacimonadota bacterium]|nr:MAG: hypothetical protein DRH57_08290 [Candidatus Cloacimonadota bacterium]
MIQLWDLPKQPYQILARAIRNDYITPVPQEYIKEMFKLRQFEDYVGGELNMVDIHLVLEYIHTEYSIETHPEMWL